LRKDCDYDRSDNRNCDFPLQSACAAIRVATLSDNEALAMPRRLTSTTLLWAVGTFCAVVGTLLLVTPHQFESSDYTVLQSHSLWWGAALLMAGVALHGTATLTPPRSVTAAVHLAAGGMLLLFAYRFGSEDGLPNAIAFGALSAGLILTAWQPRATGEADAGPDAFALTIAVSAILLGGAFLALRGQFDSRLYDTVRAGLPALGIVFLGGGLLLLLVQIRPASRAAVWSGHLIVGLGYCLFAALVTIPDRSWAGSAYFGAMGLTVALLPWLAPVLRHLTPRSLQTRLALILIALASLPLVIAVSVSAAWAEHLIEKRALTDQEVRARTQSREVADYIVTHRTAMATVGARVNLSTLTPEVQRASLKTLVVTDVGAFATYDPAGKPLARSDDLPLTPLEPALLETVARTGAATELLVRSPYTMLPLLIFAAPTVGTPGQPSGVITAELETSRLGAALARRDPGGRTGAQMMLVDAGGRALAHPDAGLSEALADISGYPAVAAVRGSADAGTLRYTTEAGMQLAAFARIPDAGWGLIVERPLSSVLDSTRAARDLALVVLVVAIAAAAVTGVFLANRLVAPLRALMRAVDRVATGGGPTPLPTRGVIEVVQLAARVGELEDRIAARTAERELLLDQERHARQDAEAAARVKDEFLSTAAHELKTPVTVLRAYAQLLQGSLPAGEGDRTTSALAALERQTGRLTRLADDLLASSRLALGRLDLQYEHIDLSTLARETVSQVQMTSRNHQLRLNAQGSITIEADPDRINQVLVNLITNAVKYSPMGGPVDVTIKEDGEQVTIAVRDEGIGIPAAKQAQLFEQFYQAHARTAHDYGGMGLGLYLSRELVRRHGGEIGIESVEGAGTTVTVHLPRAAPIAAAAGRAYRSA
jgi:signal transduction histidine kinase